MASSRTWKYSVFPSFHGPDVRTTFLSHLLKQFSYNGITAFNDHEFKRSQIIAPSLIQAIRDSKISIVVLSKNYAASSRCLDELVEILKCKEDIRQIVMTVFYGVDPSNVRKQTGEFGSNFKKTCRGKTKEERQKWSKALEDVGNIAGEHFQKWDNESKMIENIEKIARDVSNKLNSAIFWDFKDMVGIEAHLQKMQSLLHLDNEDAAMIVGICGPAGIGKTTIARALYSRLSSNFQLNCFMENIRGSNTSGLDEYGLKLRLQKNLLSKILNLDYIRIPDLGAIKEKLCDQKVLIILDDVDNLQELQTLANGTHWFGPGSRIIIITEDQKLLKQHGIKNIYDVAFPTEEEARKIFCRYAFRKSSKPDGFEKLIERVTELCSKLPLGLRVVGSYLQGKKENEWKDILQRLPEVEDVLEVGFNSLRKNDQLLFLSIAVNYNVEGIDHDHVKALLAGSDIDVRLGLKTLAFRSLIQKSEGNIVMHKLLQQMGIEAAKRLTPEERFLIHAADRNALQIDSGSTSVTGQSLMQTSTEGKQAAREALQVQKPSSSNKSIGESVSQCFTRMTFLVVNMLLEIVATVADQLSSLHKPFFARISLVMSFLSVALSIFDHLRFRYKWPIPWFDYPSHDYKQIFGSRTDTVLLFCAVGQLIASAINIYFIETGRDSPINVSAWPLCFTIGMVFFMFMGKATILKDNSCNRNVSIPMKNNK